MRNTFWVEALAVLALVGCGDGPAGGGGGAGPTGGLPSATGGASSPSGATGGAGATSSGGAGAQPGGAPPAGGTATGGTATGGATTGGTATGGTATTGGSGPCVGQPHTPGGPDPWGGCWPGPNNTGVPAGTVLSAYDGPCTITTNGTVIDAKTVACDLAIRAADVVITRSRITGTVATDEDSTGFSFRIADSEVDVGDRMATGVGAVNFTAERVHVRGGNRSMHCWHDCVIADSYVHGQARDDTGVWHESGVRMGQSATIQHNTIVCDAPDVPPDAGCSAALTGYGDFGPVQNNTLHRNLFGAGSGGYCTYGGSSSGKPYSADTNHIVFTDNVWQRGTSPSDHGDFVCGYYGAITAFDSSRPGNVWTNNRFDDDTPVAPAN